MISRGEAFALLEQVLGFRPEPTRGAEVEQAVGERLRVRKCRDANTYGLTLSDPSVRAAESRILADRLTVNETYFLREPAHLAVLSETLLPQRVANNTLPLRVLSVGCSSGEEPYGVALTLLEAGLTRQGAEIVALDASPAAIARAKSARYSDWSLRNVPPALRSRHFRKDKTGYVLSDELKSWVRFEVENVIDEFSTFWNTATFDVIFCRNLLIYLTPSSIERAVSRFARALAPGGHLFLGHAETGLAGKHFTAHHGHGGFYFRRQDATTTSQPRRDTQVAPTWLETIERSGERVQALTTSKAASPAPLLPPPASEQLLELLRSERFAEALTLLESAEPSTERGLLRAAVLTNLGRSTDAEAACEQRLAAVPRCAFAHYLLGLCHEQRGRADEARQHHGQAALLDASFALPRLRAGMLARRAGELDAARRLLREALAAFPRQGARTQLLYGGGIATEALEALCRAELTACEKAR